MNFLCLSAFSSIQQSQGNSSKYVSQFMSVHICVLMLCDSTWYFTFTRRGKLLRYEYIRHHKPCLVHSFCLVYSFCLRLCVFRLMLRLVLVWCFICICLQLVSVLPLSGIISNKCTCGFKFYLTPSPLPLLIKRYTFKAFCYEVVDQVHGLCLTIFRVPG